MFLPLASLALGLVLLVISADKFIDAAAKIASWLKVPPLIIGVLILGFGTSAPEILISTLAALENKSALALGNAYGSNIANIGLVLGLSLFLGGLTLTKQQLKTSYLFLLAITLLSLGFIYNSQLSLLEAWLLFAIFIVFVLVTFYVAYLARNSQSEEANHTASLTGTKLRRWGYLLLLVFSLAVLLASSKLLVWAATQLAIGFGVSELVIGLTLVAVGTSLPELAASLVAMRKGEQELVIGNLLGSNIFNTLAVVGLAGVIQPINFASEVFWRDGLVMLAFTLALVVLAGLKPQRIYSTSFGLILLLAYSFYLFKLF